MSLETLVINNSVQILKCSWLNHCYYILFYTDVLTFLPKDVWNYCDTYSIVYFL